VSLLVAGFDDDGPQLYQVGEDGAAAMGFCVWRRRRAAR